MPDTQTLVIIAAGLAVLFWPQVTAYLKSHKPPLPVALPLASSAPPQSRTVGSDRAEWIADLLAMQRVLSANGQEKAADLLAQSMVLIVAAKDSPAGKKA